MDDTCLKGLFQPAEVVREIARYYGINSALAGQKLKRTTVPYIYLAHCYDKCFAAMVRMFILNPEHRTTSDITFSVDNEDFVLHPDGSIETEKVIWDLSDIDPAFIDTLKHKATARGAKFVIDSNSNIHIQPDYYNVLVEDFKELAVRYKEAIEFYDTSFKKIIIPYGGD